MDRCQEIRPLIFTLWKYYPGTALKRKCSASSTSSPEIILALFRSGVCTDLHTQDVCSALLKAGKGFPLPGNDVHVFPRKALSWTFWSWQESKGHPVQFFFWHWSSQTLIPSLPAQGKQRWIGKMEWHLKSPMQKILLSSSFLPSHHASCP